MNDMKLRPASGTADRDLARTVCKRGDEVAFRELYRRHTPRLLGLVSRLLARVDAECEDVVQETWIRACTGLDDFRWESTFATWLSGIGVNVVRDHIRQRSRPQPVELESVPEPPAPSPGYDGRIDLERCIETLPERCRMVLVLHDVEGLRHEEIAQRLGIVAGTSKSQLSNARRMLRAVLSGARETGHA